MLTNNIKQLRTDKGYTQINLSALTDIPQTTLSGWESGHIDLVIERLLKLCDVLSVNVSDLLTEDGPLTKIAKASKG